MLLVDRHAITRVGMKAILAGDPDVRVIGECGCAADALRLATTLHPDVAIVDLLGGADGSGFGLVKDLREFGVCRFSASAAVGNDDRPAD